MLDLLLKVTSRLVLAGWLAAALFGADTATAEVVIYASPDGTPGFDEAGEHNAGILTLPEAIAEARKHPNKPVTIQLLTSAQGALTVYRADVKPCAFLLRDIQRTEATGLRIRGVRSGGKLLAQIAGTSVDDILAGKGLCDVPPSAPLSLFAARQKEAPARNDDLLRGIANREEAIGADAGILGAETQEHLTRCFHMSGSEWVSFEDLHFRDCWLPAIYAADSRHISLRRSLIEGSSYVFIAIATRAQPRNASDFRLEDNVWLQDTTGFGPDKAAECQEINWVADCPGEMWSTIPWGVTHDTLYEHMNGALFGAIDISGGVTISRNIIRYAYNGIRPLVSDDCFQQGAKCLDLVNTDVTIADNEFAYIRDNPVEPEARASQWNIHGNEFYNSHGWISLDNVRSGPIYIWGNTGWYSDIPARNCDDIEKWNKRKRVDFNRGGYWSLPDDWELEPTECTESRFGTVIKIGDKDQKPKHIYVFHNSWMIRTPLLRGGKTGTIHHWNNAIHFVGCGADGTELCRAGPGDCKGGMRDFFTSGRRSAAFRCVDPQAVANPSKYDFKHDFSSQALPIELRGEPRPPAGKDGFELRFADPGHGKFMLLAGSAAIGAGCRVTVKQDKTLICVKTKSGETPVDVGAYKFDGTRYQAPSLPQ